FQVDPENKLLWKMNRQRMDFEELHDSLLAVANKLELNEGGQPVDIVSEPFAKRRAVYGYIDRQNLPGLFRTFDFANPDTTSPQRFFTTVPQQALFLLNSGFVVDQAKGLGTNGDFEKQERDEDRVVFLYEKIYQRAPSKDELKAAEKFLKTQTIIASNSFTPPIWQYGFGEIDDDKKMVRFSPLTYFTNNQWHASGKYPDPELGYVMLGPVDGHPGSSHAHSAIRRWTSPFDGTIKIDGTLIHPADHGDGVKGIIFSNRRGELGSWMAQNGNSKTVVEEFGVKRGETIDFMVDMRANANSDSFQWSPNISVVKVEYGTVPPTRNNWSAQNDFDGPVKKKESLSAWEKYAQVLLLSNEFIFID
ncbi:MAG: DUF1553 domain-containing protein, partial [Verrucomicrobiota bacterium]